MHAEVTQRTINADDCMRMTQKTKGAEVSAEWTWHAVTRSITADYKATRMIWQPSIKHNAVKHPFLSFKSAEKGDLQRWA